MLLSVYVCMCMCVYAPWACMPVAFGGQRSGVTYPPCRYWALNCVPSERAVSAFYP